MRLRLRGVMLKTVLLEVETTVGSRNLDDEALTAGS